MATFYSNFYAQPAASAAYYAHPQQQQQQQPVFQAQTRAARRGVSNPNSRYTTMSPNSQYRQTRYQGGYAAAAAPSIVQRELPNEETMYRGKFEAARSFDVEDDEVFCPYLLTEDDLVSLYSGSEVSSLSSTSPNQSPVQMHVYSATASGAASGGHGSYHHQGRSHRTPSPEAIVFKPSPPSTPARAFQHPSGPRKRNPIAIVDPASGKTVGSPRAAY